MQRYAITGQLIPLSESGAPQIGLLDAVNIPRRTYDVYLASEVGEEMQELRRFKAEHSQCVDGGEYRGCVAEVNKLRARLAEVVSADQEQDLADVREERSIEMAKAKMRGNV